MDYGVEGCQDNLVKSFTFTGMLTGADAQSQVSCAD